MNSPTRYRITLAGRLDPTWSVWFDGLELHTVHGPGGPCTHLTGLIADQAMLRGLLNRVFDLNLTLLSVQSLPAIILQED